MIINMAQNGVFTGLHVLLFSNLLQVDLKIYNNFTLQNQLHSVGLLK